MKNRIKALLGAVLLGLGLVVVVATPAHAAYTCPVGNICFYTNAGGTGLILAYQATSVPYLVPETGMPNGWNDVVSSVFNNSSKTFRLCKNNPCGSTGKLDVAAGQIISWWSLHQWNDVLSAFYRTSA